MNKTACQRFSDQAWVPHTRRVLQFSFDPDARSVLPRLRLLWQETLHGTAWEDVEGHHTRLDAQGAEANIKFDYGVSCAPNPCFSSVLRDLD